MLGGAILQQVFVVEYTVNHQMCDDCHRSEAQDYWRALVSSILMLEVQIIFYSFQIAIYNFIYIILYYVIYIKFWGEH